MRTELMNKCQLLADNRDMIAKRFKWDYATTSIVPAAFLADADKEVDIQKMKECKKILKNSAGAFSSLRQHLTLPIAGKLSIAENPEQYMEELMSTYNNFKSEIKSGEFAVLASMVIIDKKDEKPIDEQIAKIKELRKALKKNHPFLIESSDFANIAMLAGTDKSVETIVEETEMAYDILREAFPMHKDAVHSLSMVLAGSDKDVQTKCQKIIDIYNALKDEGIRYSKGTEFATLGLLVDIDESVETIVADIVDADAYLKKRKGFGMWGIGKAGRRMYAVLMTADVYVLTSNSMKSSVFTATLTAAIIASAAMCGAVSATAAANN